jgi:sugar phosphate isomerase/epimerase
VSKGGRAVKFECARHCLSFYLSLAPLSIARYCSAKQNVADTLRCIDLAADVGAPVIRVFGGTMGKGLSRADAVKLVAESLHTVADHARERNVTVCLETHDDWCDPKNVAAVVQQVNHPAIAVNWDIMHPVRMKLATMDEAFETLKPWIRHLHVHDGDMLVLMPIGRGIIDHKLAIERLLSINYSGFLSGEWIDWSDAYDVHLPRELAAMKRYEKEV